MKKCRQLIKKINKFKKKKIEFMRSYKNSSSIITPMKTKEEKDKGF